jgi:hypothetical protein
MHLMHGDSFLPACKSNISPYVLSGHYLNHKGAYNMKISHQLLVLLFLSCLFLHPVCTVTERNFIYIDEIVPRDSSTLDITDTITVSIDYEFDEKYSGQPVILAIELLCGHEVVGETIALDTLCERAAYTEAFFRMADFVTLCEYELRPSYHEFRFKLILPGGSDIPGWYARESCTSLQYENWNYSSEAWRLKITPA